MRDHRTIRPRETTRFAIMLSTGAVRYGFGPSVGNLAGKVRLFNTRPRAEAFARNMRIVGIVAVRPTDKWVWS